VVVVVVVVRTMEGLVVVVVLGWCELEHLE